MSRIPSMSLLTGNWKLLKIPFIQGYSPVKSYVSDMLSAWLPEWSRNINMPSHCTKIPQWLPVALRIKSEIIIMAWESLHGLATAHLSNCFLNHSHSLLATRISLFLHAHCTPPALPPLHMFYFLAWMYFLTLFFFGASWYLLFLQLSAQSLLPQVSLPALSQIFPLFTFLTLKFCPWKRFAGVILFLCVWWLTNFCLFHWTVNSRR